MAITVCFGKPPGVSYVSPILPTAQAAEAHGVAGGSESISPCPTEFGTWGQSRNVGPPRLPVMFVGLMGWDWISWTFHGNLMGLNGTLMGLNGIHNGLNGIDRLNIVEQYVFSSVI